jgi:hypothetical protein
MKSEQKRRLQERLIKAHSFIEALARNPEVLPEHVAFAAAEFLKDCQHEVRHRGYGIGFGPMGVYELCELCGKHLAHSPDPEGVTPAQRAEEIAWCKKNKLPPVDGYPHEVEAAAAPKEIPNEDR